MINLLPDDILVDILLRVPIKYAVTTMILSKRWQSLWTMMPELGYEENDEECKSIWYFLDKSFQLHKAPVLDNLYIQLGPQCPIDADVGKWITNAVSRKIRILRLGVDWSKKLLKLPNSLYTCDTLVSLSLYGTIIVDIVTPACLPSLDHLALLGVRFKDDDSLVGLLSSCPNLKELFVIRYKEDNVTNFNVKTSSLESLTYVNVYLEEFGNSQGSLVIDSPILKTIIICDYSGDSFSIENKCCLDKASIKVLCSLGYKIKRCLSSLIYLDVVLTTATFACFTTSNFSQLIECRIQPYEFDWLEPLMVLVQNSPKLKVLLIDLMDLNEDFPISWNRPSSVPKCLLTNLEIFEWKEYGGRIEEKELVKYILANSRCLKRVAISIRSTCILEGKEKTMMDELKSMPRISESSVLMFETFIDRRDIYMLQRI